MVPEVVKSGTRYPVHEVITSGGYLGSVQGGGDVLISIPKPVMHNQRYSSDGDLIRFVKSELAFASCTVGNLPPAVVRLPVGKYSISGRNDSLSSVSRKKT